MDNCVSPAVAVPDATPTPVPDEKDIIIVNLKMDLMWQRLLQKCKSLKLKCRSLTVKLERSEDEYREQVAVSTELKAKLWLLKSEAIPRMKELTFLRCSKRYPRRN